MSVLTIGIVRDCFNLPIFVSRKASETGDAVVRGEASFEQTRFETNKPEAYCLFSASLTGCNF